MRELRSSGWITTGLKAKDLCPGCGKGKLYEMNATGVLIRVVGATPIQAKVKNCDAISAAKSSPPSLPRESVNTSTIPAPEP